MKNFWKNYNLSIVLCMLFLSTWIGQGITEYRVFVLDAEQHGQDIEMSKFFWYFGQSTLENWESEFLQLFSFVVLTSFLIHKGSHESKDGQEKFEREVKERFDRLETQLSDMRKVSRPVTHRPGRVLS